MAQFINKAALVAEIKRLKTIYNDDENIHHIAKYNILVDILSFLDTLEVKEVDLEKELNDFIEQQKAWIKDDWVVEYNNGDSFNHIYDLKEIAKHFFELGLKASQKEERDATQQEIQDRMEVCPWREHSTGNHYVCTRFSDTNVPCNGACMWVIDNLKLKELKSKLKAQKGEEV